jgi:hypothetical protein
MKVEVEISEDIADLLDTDLESFAQDATIDRVKIFHDSLDLLHEKGWSENELQWATRALGTGNRFPSLEDFATELENSKEWPQESPSSFDVPEDRADKLIRQVRGDGQIATALELLSRDYGNIATPVEE